MSDTILDYKFIVELTKKIVATYVIGNKLLED